MASTTGIRQLAPLAIGDALSLLVLIAKQPHRLDAAAVRWLGRLALEGRQFRPSPLHPRSRTLGALRPRLRRYGRRPRRKGGGGSCSDGPVAFATFGAPVDVAVGKDGTIWVADAGCNSIREIKGVWADKEASAISGALKGILGGLAGRLPKSTVDKIQGLIDSQQPDFIEANRWWVITVAGSREGAGGFRDGLAGQSLLSGPMGIAVAPGSSGITYVFASDSGNRRVRLLTVPG